MIYFLCGFISTPGQLCHVLMPRNGRLLSVLYVPEMLKVWDCQVCVGFDPQVSSSLGSGSRCLPGSECLVQRNAVPFLGKFRVGSCRVPSSPWVFFPATEKAGTSQCRPSPGKGCPVSVTGLTRGACTLGPGQKKGQLQAGALGSTMHGAFEAPRPGQIPSLLLLLVTGCWPEICECPSCFVSGRECGLLGRQEAPTPVGNPLRR